MISLMQKMQTELLIVIFSFDYKFKKLIVNFKEFSWLYSWLITKIKSEFGRIKLNLNLVKNKTDFIGPYILNFLHFEIQFYFNDSQSSHHSSQFSFWMLIKLLTLSRCFLFKCLSVWSVSALTFNPWCKTSVSGDIHSQLCSVHNGAQLHLPQLHA